MNRISNVFILTTEYHFLLSMSIIDERYSSSEFNNLLVFTGQRLSGVVLENLPANVKIIEIVVEQEVDLKKKIDETIFQHAIENLFVFTAYRDLETYLLWKAPRPVKKHLIQNGSNFYFKILKSVAISRLKETLKIYRNLWRKGILLTKIVLYKKHPAQCAFVDFVWIANPEIYQEPPFFRKPLIKIELLRDEKVKQRLNRYFAMDGKREYTNYLIYLSPRLTQEGAIVLEIAQLKSIIAKLSKHKLLIKLHPNTSNIQANLLEAAFKDGVVKNFVPAELYIANATDSYIIGAASTSLYYHNPRCKYFALIKVYQGIGIFPDWIEAKFPPHVKVLENLNELTGNSD